MIWLNPYLKNRKVTAMSLRTLGTSLHQGCPWLYRDLWQVHSDTIDTVYHCFTLMRALYCLQQRGWYVMDWSHVFLYCIWWQCQFCIDSLGLSLPLSPCFSLQSFSSFVLFDLTFSPFHFSFICVGLPSLILMDIVQKQLYGSLSLSQSLFLFIRSQHRSHTVSLPWPQYSPVCRNWTWPLRASGMLWGWTHLNCQGKGNLLFTVGALTKFNTLPSKRKLVYIVPVPFMWLGLLCHTLITSSWTLCIHIAHQTIVLLSPIKKMKVFFCLFLKQNENILGRFFEFDKFETL